MSTHDVAGISVAVECSCGAMFWAKTEDDALERLLEHRRREESKTAHPASRRPERTYMRSSPYDEPEFDE